MMIRIRFHGRGGHGIKTASRIAGTAASMEGFNVQDFPLYGAERRGAPLTAYTRISDGTIFERGIISSPDIVIIADDSLIEDPMADPLNGADTNTIIIINTNRPHDISEGLAARDRVLLIDATEISMSVIGKGSAISAAMGAAACRVTGLINKATVEKAVVKELTSIGISSEEIIRKNVEVAGTCFDSLPSFEIITRAETSQLLTKTIVLPYEAPAISTPNVIASGNIIERKTGKWRTFRPVINYDKCNHCWICFVWCPDGVISLDDKEFPHIDYDHCKGCLICYEECPIKAITVERESSSNEQ